MINHKKILPVKTLLVSAVGLLLAGCGGGGGSTSVNPDPDSEYVGSRSPATLNRTNVLEFTSLLYGQSDASDILLGRSGSSGLSFTGILAEISTLKRLVSGSRVTGEPLLQARTVSETVNCTFGGTLKGVGDVNESTETGTIKFTFTNCEEESGVVLNGVASQTVHSSSDPESYTLKMDGLSITQNGASYSQTGVLTYYWENSTDGSEPHVIETINLVTTNDTTSEQAYLQNISVEQVGGTAALSGKLYLSGEGYVTLSGSSDLDLSSDDVSLPVDGFVYLSGAGGSTARIASLSYDFERYTLELDEDGDGLFEATSIQDVTADELTDLVDS